MTKITKEDITLEHHNEPRIQDLRLAAALGFDRPRDIRKIIERCLDNLKQFGEVVCATVAQTPKGGRPGKEYYLNEKQALFICTKSEAKNATDITIEMVNVFHAVKTGERLPATGEVLSGIYHPDDGRKECLDYQVKHGPVMRYEEATQNPFDEFGPDGVAQRVAFVKQVRQTLGIKPAKEAWAHVGFPPYGDIIAVLEGKEFVDIRKFIADCCVVTGAPKAISYPPDLYKAYVTWCMEMKMQRLGRDMFYKSFSKLASTEVFKTPQGPYASFTKGKSNNALYRGIVVRDEYLRNDMIALSLEDSDRVEISET